MRWIAVTERLPEGADAISCEAWCEAEEPGEVAGPCIMSYDAELDPLDPWSSREDTGCWEPGPVTHWRSRPAAPGQEDTMGVIGADGKKHHLFLTRAEEDAAVARSPLKVADDLITLAGKVGAAIPAATRGVKVRPVDECAPYLKEGETPSECIARNRKDAAAVFSYYDDAQRWRAVRDLLGEIETEFVKLEDLPAWIRKMQDSLREARNAGVTGAPAPFTLSTPADSPLRALGVAPTAPTPLEQCGKCRKPWLCAEKGCMDKAASEPAPGVTGGRASFKFVAAPIALQDALLAYQRRPCDAEADALIRAVLAAHGVPAVRGGEQT